MKASYAVKALERNPASLENQESLMEDDAMVWVRPLEPVYKKPWVRDERKREEEMVEEAVEKKPLRPRTVEVELYPVLTVNGKEKE